MRVVHVLNGLNDGGIDALAQQMMRATQALSESYFVSMSPVTNSKLEQFEDVTGLSREAIRVPAEPMGAVARVLYMCEACKAFRADAVIIYPFQRPMLLVALGARMAGVSRLAVHIGNTAPAAPAGKRVWQRLLMSFQVLGVRAVPCTQAIVDSLQPLPRMLRLGPVIGNGCDVDAIARCAQTVRQARPPNDPRRIVMVARLDAIKDQETLLRAFAEVRPVGWNLQLVGEGSERRRLEDLARQLGLESAEIFLGRRTDVPELLGQADLFVLSTTPAEGFGIALIEAMAAGLPVLASDVPACREVLRDGAAGELLPARDVARWSSRLRELTSDASLRHNLAARAQEHAAEYDIRETAKQWYGVLNA